MKKLTFVAIFVPDQDPDTGTIKVNHINKKLANTVFFSAQFNLKKDSMLKQVINDVREELFKESLDKLNQELPEGMGQYLLAKPRTVANMFSLRGQLVIPVEFLLSVDDDVVFTKNAKDFIDAFLLCNVLSYEVLKPRICNHPKESYAAWKLCPFGAKRDFFKWIEKEKRRAHNGQGFYPFKEAFKKVKTRA